MRPAKFHANRTGITLASLIIFLACSINHALAESFSSSQTFAYGEDDVTLNLSGHTIRSKFIFDIYSMAHYMQWPSLKNDEVRSKDQAVDLILSGDYPQQIDIVFKRNLKANQIVGALVGGIKSNCLAEEFDSIQSPLATFKQAVSVDVKKQTKFQLRWLPSGSLEGFYEGEKVMNIDDPLFAKLLWSVWFGERPVIKTQELLSNQVSVL